MLIIIEGRTLPGRRFVSDGVPLANVHVGVQVGAEPVDLVPGDVETTRWEVEVRPVVDDGAVDLRGKPVHGKRGERFLYLTWGDVGADGSFAMFRRAKLMVSDIGEELLAGAAATDGTVVATVELTDEHGGPRCARVRPPAVSWRAG